MFKRLDIICLALMVILAGYVVIDHKACAQEAAYIKINELISSAENMDGKDVIIQGEVIGDVMPRRNGYLWFNVQDSSGVIGVWAHGELAREIIVAGDYNYKGDEVEVAGTYVTADRELSGETCLRAKSVDILKRGRRFDHAINPIKTKIAAVLAVLAGLLLLLRAMIQRKS